MDTFTDGIFRPDMEIDTNTEFFQSLPNALKEDIKITLIDDRVQFGYESLQDRIIDGWSFDDGYDSVDLPRARKPFHESQTGHGTLMANMICRICPTAKLSVCRLKVLPGRNEKSTFTTESTAQAVDYCATRGSTLFQCLGTSRRVMEISATRAAVGNLEAALKRAQESKALLFCAAPDEGSMTDERFGKYYPVGSKTQLFKIGAATATNAIHGKTGNETQLDFLLPGHEVTQRGRDLIELEENSPKTGSSVATALATELAALILHCVRFAAIENQNKDGRGRKNRRHVRIS